MTAYKHVRSLDGLRWFAFLAVFLFHAHESIYRFGQYGVQVFFVLSGFLIGNILLSLRESPHLSTWSKLKVFYARRALRIFPLYYLVLALIFLLASLHLIAPRPGVLLYHALYLTNFYLALTGAQIDSQTHLWSLCVEEHFYLFAPLILLRVSYRRLESGFVAMVVMIVMARLTNYFFWGNPRFDYFSPIQFDVLGVGVVVAMLHRHHTLLGLNQGSFRRVGRYCAAVSVATLAWSYFPSMPQRFVEAVLLPPILGVAVGSLVSDLWSGRFPNLGAFLSWSPFVFLGRISYGLYLYHNFFFVVARGSVGFRHELRLAGALVLTILVATASWFLFEKPLLSLKNRFKYTGEAAERERRAASTALSP